MTRNRADVAAARRNGHDPTGGIDGQRVEIDRRIFPNLIVDEACEPEGKESVEQGFLAARILAVHRGIDRRQTHRVVLMNEHPAVMKKYSFYFTEAASFLDEAHISPK